MDKSCSDGLVANQNRLICILLLIVLGGLTTDEASPDVI